MPLSKTLVRKYGGEDAEYFRLLDLLAVIHRDGGHHTENVGLDQSIEDAVNKILAAYDKVDSLNLH